MTAILNLQGAQRQSLINCVTIQSCKQLTAEITFYCTCVFLALLLTSLVVCHAPSIRDEGSGMSSITHLCRWNAILRHDNHTN